MSLLRPHFVSYRFDDLREAARLFEGIISERLAANPGREALDGPEGEAVVWYSASQFREVQLWPALLRRSHLVATMSALELRLARLAEVAGIALSAPSLAELRSSRKVRGGGISRFSTYFRTIGVPLPTHDARWGRLQAWYALRNIIVHRGGLAVAGPHETKTRKRVSVLRSAGLTGLGEVWINEAGCADAIDDADGFLAMVDTSSPHAS